jgi:hypothetical protein
MAKRTHSFDIKNAKKPKEDINQKEIIAKSSKFKKIQIPKIFIEIIFINIKDEIINGSDEIKKTRLTQLLTQFSTLIKENKYQEGQQLLIQFISDNDSGYIECVNKFIKWYGVNNLEKIISRILFHIVVKMFIRKVYKNKKPEENKALIKILRNKTIKYNKSHIKTEYDKKKAIYSTTLDMAFQFFTTYEPMYNLCKEKILERLISNIPTYGTEDNPLDNIIYRGQIIEQLIHHIKTPKLYDNDMKSIANILLTLK